MHGTQISLTSWKLACVNLSAARSNSLHAWVSAKARIPKQFDGSSCFFRKSQQISAIKYEHLLFFKSTQKLPTSIFKRFNHVSFRYLWKLTNSFLCLRSCGWHWVKHVVCHYSIVSFDTKNKICSLVPYCRGWQTPGHSPVPLQEETVAGPCRTRAKLIQKWLERMT